LELNRNLQEITVWRLVTREEDRQMKGQEVILADTPAKFTAFATIMTALVALCTYMFQISIPATQGYFDLGDSVVFLSALLFGPIVGAVSGGVGSMLSDLVAAPIYAPGTLVIKGFEGFIVGSVFQRIRSGGSKEVGRKGLAAAGLILGFFFISIGIGLYSGVSQDPMIWIIVSAIASLLISGIVYYYRHDTVGIICALSVFVGGASMVIGYYLYESIFLYALLGLKVVAVAEVAPNIVQALVSMAIALPVYRRVREAIAL
jgi:uncharacterized membrane protein